MDWKKERDLLIAQTAAFVQSVAGNRPESEAGPKPASPPDALESVEQPLEIRMVRTALPASSDARTEIDQHVSNFRAHQQRFHREREEYFAATLARARAAIEREASAAAPGDAKVLGSFPAAKLDEITQARP
jgi:hypothetical protein